MMDAATFIGQMMGRSWTVEEHCWNLVRAAQLQCFGVIVPAVLISDKLEAPQLVRAFHEHPERKKWARCDGPADGAIVLMNKGGKHGRAIHAGVYFEIDGGGILHVDDPHGVVFEDASVIQLRGWTCEFYKLG